MENEAECRSPTYLPNSIAFCSHTKEDVMKCECGEEENDFAWVWSADKEIGQAGKIVLGAEQRQVIFNPEYSSGTAAVRGGKLLLPGYHHYWELKMTSTVYGTNIMVGVCTPKCDMKQGIHRFCSLLGRDAESWGYSYFGTIQHGSKQKRYGPRWGKGSIIGMHLDTWRGTLEFFLNREPLGIAFTGLCNQELYPIVSSTSANTGMKLVSSYMFSHSLQFLSSEAVFRKIFQSSNTIPEHIKLPPGLHRYIMNNHWPFIKFGSKRASDDTLDYARAQNPSKRSLEEEEPTDVKKPKKLYRYHSP
ncbi:SPRY domain-containing SOCS box protein 3 [Halocaridina rubra]|uniref:SPRY domain-containing SOCS box protein 3 n=1 Tax=Halocaridina rubra TaxID=373956 RepID=A0AAN8XH03_HALRR